jgi:hypothetical protein
MNKQKIIKDYSPRKHRAIISHPGVFEYEVGSVYRSAEVVTNGDTLESLIGVPVAITHDMLDENNWREHIVGSVVGYDFVDGVLIAKFVINDADVEKMIQDEELCEVSMGYTAEVVQEEGVYEGQPYDHKVHSVKYNHMTLGPKGWARVARAEILDCLGDNRTKAIKIDDKGRFEKIMKKITKTNEDVVKDLCDVLDEVEEEKVDEVEEEAHDQVEEEEEVSDEDKLQALVDRVSQLEVKLDALLKDGKEEVDEEHEDSEEEVEDEVVKEDEVKDSKLSFNDRLQIALDCKSLKPSLETKDKTVKDMLQEVLGKKGSVEYLKGILDAKLEDKMTVSKFDSKVSGVNGQAGAQTKTLDDIFFGRK